MTFPCAPLVASTDRLFGNLFANPTAGVPRALYWDVAIDFEPLSYAGETPSSSMTCEGIPWQARTRRCSDGNPRRSHYGYPGVEPSFCFIPNGAAENNPAAVATREGTQLGGTLKMAVDFSGYPGGDANDEMSVSGCAVNAFGDVSLRPDSFDLAPSSESEDKALAGEFLDVSDFVVSEEAGGALILWPAHGERS